MARTTTVARPTAHTTTNKPKAAGKAASAKATDAGDEAAAPKAKGKAKASEPGTAVAVRKQGNIVNIQDQLRQQAAAMAERTQAPGGNKIKVTQDKQFVLPDGAKVEEIDVVVVDFATVHNFYEGKFDKNNIVPPGCFAVGFNPKAMAPVDESPNKQADSCQGCPMNEFGSDGTGKACKNGRRLAVLPPNDAGDDVDADEATDLMILDVSPTALKNWDGYVQALARTFQLPPVGFITHVSFDESVDYPRLKFSDPRPIASLEAAFARQEEAKELLLQIPDFSGYVAPGAKGRAAAPARAPARGGKR